MLWVTAGKIAQVFASCPVANFTLVLSTCRSIHRTHAYSGAALACTFPHKSMVSRLSHDQLMNRGGSSGNVLQQRYLSCREHSVRGSSLFQEPISRLLDDTIEMDSSIGFPIQVILRGFTHSHRLHLETPSGWYLRESQPYSVALNVPGVAYLIFDTEIPLILWMSFLQILTFPKESLPKHHEGSLGELADNLLFRVLLHLSSSFTDRRASIENKKSRSLDEQRTESKGEQRARENREENAESHETKVDLNQARIQLLRS